MNIKKYMKIFPTLHHLSLHGKSVERIRVLHQIARKLVMLVVLIATANCFSAENPERVMAQSSSVIKIASEYLDQVKDENKNISLTSSIEIVQRQNIFISICHEATEKTAFNKDPMGKKRIYEKINDTVKQMDEQISKIDDYLKNLMNHSKYKAFSEAVKKYHLESAQYRKALQAEMEKIGKPDSGKPDEGSPSKATFSGSDGGGNANASNSPASGSGK